MDSIFGSTNTFLQQTSPSKFEKFLRKSIDKREAKKKNKTLKAKNEYRVSQRLQKQNNSFLITVSNTLQTHEKYVIEMEYLEYNLEQFLFKYQISNQIKNQLLISIVKGLIQLDMTHRDLKLQNLMVKVVGEEVKCVHIDFQTCKEIVGETNSFVGTLFYQAPEVFRNQPYDDKADMFSLGVMIFQLYDGITMQDNKKRMRFPGIDCTEATIYEYYHAIQAEGGVSLRNKVPKPIKTLIKKLLVIDPAQRYSLKQVIEHLKDNFYQLFNSNPQQDKYQFNEFFKYYIEFADKEVKKNIIKKRYHRMKSLLRNQFSYLFQSMKKTDLQSSAIEMLELFYGCCFRVLEELYWLKEKVQLKEQIFQKEFLSEEQAKELKNFQGTIGKILKKFINVEELQERTKTHEFFNHGRLKPQVKEKMKKLGYIQFNEALQTLH